MLAFYVDPKVIDTSNFFDGEISRYVDFIRATKPVAGVDTVLIPGDPERKMRAERTKNGIPLARRYLGGDREYRARGRRQRSQHPAGRQLINSVNSNNCNDHKGKAINDNQ